MVTCPKCGKDFEPTKRNIKWYDKRCRRCKQDYDNAWRAKRKADGKRAYWYKPDTARTAKRLYVSRPEIKKRLAQRAKDRLLDPVERLKAQARWMVRHRVASGTITKQACILCGEKSVDAHHKDYSKPLMVVWLCKPCHRTQHALADKVSK